MTAETIHTCSYSCERPECIRAQRDELAARLTAAMSQPAEAQAQGGGEVVQRLRGVLEHGKMGDKCLIAPDLVTAAIAALSAPKPRMVGCEGDDGLIRTHPEAETCDVCAPKPEPAEAQPVAKLVNRKDADGGKTTTFIRPTSLGMDLPLGEYPLHLHPPPSAPVGVGYAKRLATSLWQQHYREDSPQWEPCEDLMGLLSQIDNMVSGLTRAAQQPVAVDVAAAKRAVAAVMSAPDGISVEAFFRIVLEAAVAGQRQEPTT